MASLSEARRVVVKVGSALLVEDGRLRVPWLNSLAEDVAWLKSEGKDVALVSSGAIALGRATLELPDGALPLEKSQAAAAVGQIRLARAYEEVLAPFGISTAQVLVTLEDSADRRRYLNSRATLEQLLGLGAVPIVNENDTVATDEIRFGDNDRLAAQIAVTVGADVLVLLSDVDGLYSGNPKTDAEARRIDFVDSITPEIEAMAGDAGTGLSKGGMKTKILAAKTAAAGGAAGPSVPLGGRRRDLDTGRLPHHRERGGRLRLPPHGRGQRTRSERARRGLHARRRGGLTLPPDRTRLRSLREGSTQRSSSFRAPFIREPTRRATRNSSGAGSRTTSPPSLQPEMQRRGSVHDCATPSRQVCGPPARRPLSCD